MTEDKGVMTLPAKLRELRLAAGLNLVELGQKAGLSHSYLGRIEKGERFPSAPVLAKLAPALGVPETELFKVAGYLKEVPLLPSWLESQMPQELSAKVLAVGHKVSLRQTPIDWPSGVGRITAIRVWHDMDTYLGEPYRAVPIFDIEGDGWKVDNVKIGDIMLLREPPLLPAVTEEVKTNAGTAKGKSAEPHPSVG